jgi:hypothetical protein
VQLCLEIREFVRGLWADTTIDASDNYESTMEEADHATDASSIPLIDDNWCDYTPELLKKNRPSYCKCKAKQTSR